MVMFGRDLQDAMHMARAIGHAAIRLATASGSLPKAVIEQ
jgi:hypothetical protein